MSDYVLFQMWKPFRQSLIAGHSFYVEQAQKRLLSQFEDMEAEADRASEEWLEQSSQNFDPDRHDPGDFYEAANDAGIEFYTLLSEMRDQTRLSVVAGMFHEWDKQLRDWLVREIQHWHHGENVAVKVWAVDFGKIADLLESLGWDIRNRDYFAKLDACRLVVNVYKHGQGKSLADLKSQYPEYLDDRLIIEGIVDLRDYNHLKISDEHIEAFSKAIISFWKDVPENVFESQILDVPDWFGNAILNSAANGR